MAGIDKTYANTWDEYKDVFDWCKSVGIVTDEYGNRLYPYSWLYNTHLTENDFGNNDFGNNKWHIIWSTGFIQDLYIIRHCPCKVVQERMKKVYPTDYIQDVLNFNTEYDKFKRPENKNPHFTIKWIKKSKHKTKKVSWDINAYDENGELYGYNTPIFNEFEDRWQFPYDTYYTEKYDYAKYFKGPLTNRRIYRKLRKWGLPKGTKLKFIGFTKYENFEFDLIVK